MNFLICGKCIDGYILDKDSLTCVKCSEKIDNCTRCYYDKTNLLCSTCIFNYYSLNKILANNTN